MAFKNIVDDSSTTITANTPGVTLDLRYHGTLARSTVPVRLFVYASSTVAADTGVVSILDSAGVSMVTANVTGTTAQWYAADGAMPASLAKYDAWYGNNTTGSLSVYAFSLFELAPNGAVSGVASWSLGALTIAGTGTSAVPSPPTYQATGTQVYATASTTSPSWPTHATDDIALCYYLGHHGSADPGAATLSTANGFTVIGSVNGTDGSEHVRTTVAWCRATSGAMSAPVWAHGSEADSAAIIVTYRGCTTSGNPYDVTSSSGSSALGTTATITGATTTVASTLVAVGVSAYEPGKAATTYSGWANASLTSVTESSDATSGGRAIGTAYGGKSAAGAYGNYTATLDQSDLWSGMTIALKP